MSAKKCGDALVDGKWFVPLYSSSWKTTLLHYNMVVAFTTSTYHLGLALPFVFFRNTAPVAM